MRPITAWLLGSLSVLWIVAPTPSDAAVIRQNFELTVTSLGYRPGDAPSTVPLPLIGTKGTGSFAYDEANINYIDNPSYPVGYYLGRPGRIAFSDFSLNFFDRTYTKGIPIQSRIGEIFLFDRTSSGQYMPQNLVFDTSDGSSIVTIIGNTFSYTPVPSAENGAISSAIGTLRYTDSEPVPEPSSAIVPFLALGMGWLCHRRQTARKNF